MEIDNTTALACVGNMDERLFQMNTLARKIWIWCKSRNIYLSVAYIASEDNTDADLESRMSHDNIEWMLNKHCFHKICVIFGKPEIDLFASRLNKQLDCYVSWKPDPFAWTEDAFTFGWSKFFVYAFPPFTLIGRILQKIELDMVKQAIVIVPFWTTQPWFSKLGKMLINCPLLPRRINTLLHPTKAKHELNKLQLIACNLSGNTTRTEEFRKEEQTFCCPLGETQRKKKSYIKRWIRFCGERNVNIMSPYIINFMTMCMDELKLGYSALNTVRTSLSSFIMIDSHSIGSHPIISRFMKGVFQIKPAIPKNIVIWDTSIVLAYL